MSEDKNNATFAISAGSPILFKDILDKVSSIIF